MEEVGIGWRAGPLATARAPWEAFTPLARSMQAFDHRGLPDPEGDDKRLRAHVSRSAGIGEDFRLKVYMQPSQEHLRFSTGLKEHQFAAKSQGLASYRYDLSQMTGDGPLLTQPHSLPDSSGTGTEYYPVPVDDTN